MISIISSEEHVRGCDGALPHPPPRPDKGSDRRILLERVSKEYTIKSRIPHTNFSDAVSINCDIHSSKWRKLYTLAAGMIPLDIFLSIGYYYSLEDTVIDRPKLYYKIFIGKAVNMKIVVLESENEVGGKIMMDEGTDITREIILSDCELNLRYRIDNAVERDCNYDFSYMLEAMDCVGKSLREVSFYQGR